MRALAMMISVVLGVACVACTDGLEEAARTLRSPSVAPTPAPTSASAGPSATPSGRIAIAVTAPLGGAKAVSPVLVTGRARTSSGSVRVRVLDAAGNELAAMDVPISCGAGCAGTFRARLAFYVRTTQRGLVGAVDLSSGNAAEVRVRLVRSHERTVGS